MIEYVPQTPTLMLADSSDPLATRKSQYCAARSWYLRDNAGPKQRISPACILLHLLAAISIVVTRRRGQNAGAVPVGKLSMGARMASKIRLRSNND